MPAPYVVRERVLSPHIRPDRPVVYDVTEAHTTRAVPYGVHTCPDRAHVHADRLTRRAWTEFWTRTAEDHVERARDRARIATNDERRAREVQAAVDE